MFHLVSGMGMAGPQMHRFLEDYRQRLARASKDEILARDLRFTEEGIGMAAQRLGEHISDPLRQGFHEGYQQA